MKLSRKEAHDIGAKSAELFYQGTVFLNKYGLSRPDSKQHWNAAVCTQIMFRGEAFRLELHLGTYQYNRHLAKKLFNTLIGEHQAFIRVEPKQPERPELLEAVMGVLSGPLSQERELFVVDEEDIRHVRANWGVRTLSYGCIDAHTMVNAAEKWFGKIASLLNQHP